MIERERWAQLLLNAPSGGGLADTTEQKSGRQSAATIGVCIEGIATAVLHQDEHGGDYEQLGASNEMNARMNARLMRIVFDEVPKDALDLLEVAESIELYAEQEALPLPLYASSTPSGRLVVNVCAFASFDETSEAIECLQKITQKSPQELTQNLAQKLS